MYLNPINDRVNGHRAFDERSDFFPGGEGFQHGMGRGRRGEGFRDGGRDRAHDDFHAREGFHNHCDGFGDVDRHGESRRAMPRGFGPGGHGGPRHGMPPFGDRGDLPPRRPDQGFLKQRIEDGDLMELIDMAGRMSHRRPQGGPARGQALVLSILAGREALSQRELQQMLGIQPGSLSELISKLEAKGLLTREKAEDRRGNLLRITDAGRQAIPEADTASEAEDPFAPLTAQQQDQLSAMLRTLLTAWVEEM